MASAEQIPSEKPLHVRVAEALGWRDLSGPDEDSWEGILPGFNSHKNWVPRYDTDWSSAGPLIERFGIHIVKTLSGWIAAHDMNWIMGGLAPACSPTPLIAVCEAILALKAAGKL